jgi:polar amino acid transport system substrate-binding protein
VNLKKLNIVVLFSVLSLILLLGSSSIFAQGSVAENSILDQIIKRGEISVGMILTLPPIASRDDKGNPVGFEPDIAQFLADTLGVKLTIIELTGPTRVPAVAAGKVDIAIADFTRTLERSKTIAFSEVPYMNVGLTFLLPKNSKYNTYKDLEAAGNSLTIGISRGGTSEQNVPILLPKAVIKKFSEHADEFLALQSGTVDVVSEDSIFVALQVKMHPELYKSTGEVFTREEICAGVSANDFKWFNWVNLFFHELNASGKTNELYVKWFGSEPPKISSWVSGN